MGKEPSSRSMRMTQTTQPVTTEDEMEEEIGNLSHGGASNEEKSQDLIGLANAAERFSTVLPASPKRKGRPLKARPPEKEQS